MTTAAAAENEPLTEEQARLVERNVGFALHMAGVYARDLPHLREEFESACLACLEDAARAFEAGKGVAFTTYAHWRMRSARNGVVRHESPLWFRRLGGGPQRVEPEGGFDAIADGGKAPGDDVDDADQVEQLLTRLTDFERDIIERHYWQGQTLTAVAKALGLSKEAVSKAHRKALERMARGRGGKR